MGGYVLYDNNLTTQFLQSENNLHTYLIFMSGLKKKHVKGTSPTQ